MRFTFIKVLSDGFYVDEMQSEHKTHTATEWMQNGVCRDSKLNYMLLVGFQVD